MAKRPAKKKPTRISDHDFDALDGYPEPTQKERDRETARVMRRMTDFGLALEKGTIPFVTRWAERQERQTAAFEKLADAAAHLAKFGAHLVSALESELGRIEPKQNSIAPEANQSAATSEKPADVAASSTYSEGLKRRIADAHEAARIARRASDMVVHHEQLELAQKLEAELHG